MKFETELFINQFDLDSNRWIKLEFVGTTKNNLSIVLNLKTHTIDEFDKITKSGIWKLTLERME